MNKTTNDLLEFYILDLSIGVSSIKEEFLPIDITLEMSEFNYVGLDEGTYKFYLLDSIVCIYTLYR